MIQGFLDKQCTNLPFAVSNKNGELFGYESLNNGSGPILDDNAKVREGTTKKYNVKTSILCSLKVRIGTDEMPILKLDLEVTEYELLKNFIQEDLDGSKQIFIQIYHHYVQRYRHQDNKKVVQKMTDYGYKFFSLDDHNYLFYR